MLAGAFTSFSVLTKFSGGVTTTLNGFKDFDNVLSNANSTIGSMLLPPVNGATADATDLAAALAGSPLQSGATGIADASQALSEQLEQVSVLLSTATSVLGQALGQNGQYPVSQAGPLLFRSGLGVLFGFACYLVGSLMGLVGKPWGARALRGSLPILLLTIGGVWSFGAVFFAVALAGSDVCVAPGAAVLAILNTVGSSSLGVAYNTTKYYTAATCDPAGNPPIGAYAEMVSGLAQANASLGSVVDLNTTIYKTGNQTLIDASKTIIASLAGHLDDAVGGISETLQVLSCPAVSAVFDEVLNGLCNGIIGNAVIIWGIATAAGILLVVLASSATSLACRHPGDPEADEHKALVDDDADFLDTTYGAPPASRRLGAASLGTSARRTARSDFHYASLPGGQAKASRY